jgi:DNA gyrase/topoisomerase IV subunit B
MAENAVWNEPGEDDPANLQARQIAAHIRRRPHMFIGDSGPTGLHRLAYELIDYGLAEISSGHGKSIHIQINADGSITVADDGLGIPIETHATGKLTTLEWVMTRSTGAEFHGAERVYRTGLHGMGARAVTALSDWADATVCRGDRVYRQRYERGLSVGHVCDAGPAGTQTGTKGTLYATPSLLISCVHILPPTLPARRPRLRRIGRPRRSAIPPRKLSSPTTHSARRSSSSRSSPANNNCRHNA